MAGSETVCVRQGRVTRASVEKEPEDNRPNFLPNFLPNVLPNLTLTFLQIGNARGDIGSAGSRRGARARAPVQPCAGWRRNVTE